MDAMPAHEITGAFPVAYFCAEYGFDARLPLYAGGLGILAGDTIKQAADQAFPMVGIGLLYHGFGAVQKLDEHGLQLDANFEFDPLTSGLEHVYLDDQPLFVRVHLTTVTIWLRVWKKTFANGVVLYLLDTDTDQNHPAERNITTALYSGTDEAQLKQQFLLGIGGVKLLKKLGITPSVYHLNEGRPAFAHWQLIRMLMDQHHIDYESARVLARQKTVYTNHTLVGAGNKGYSVELVKQYAQYYAQKMGIGVEHLVTPGVEDSPDVFSITRFALNVSSSANGVSEYHTQLSKETWPEYHWSNITNGVHAPTWQDQTFTNALDDSALWQQHLANKRTLEQFVKQRTGYGYNPEQLTITWARRLAGYKQLEVLFADLDRLDAILRKKNQTVQLLVSGKAHQGDTAGKAMLQEVISYFQTRLSGQALFIPNYDLEVAQMLTRGSDVWINTPILGKEACGTSGMKAISNGVLHCSVADGWAREVDWNGTGWTLDPQQIAPSLYSLLENTVVPSFYTRDEQGLPQDWLKRMRKSIALFGRFSAQRMLNEYVERLYQTTNIT